MTTVVTFTVLGKPVPQGSKRLGRTRSGQPLMLDQNDGQLRSWRQDIGWAAKEAGAELLEGPVQIRALFRFTRPASVSVKKRPLPSVKPDVDKLARALCDALTGIAWRDDAQVVDLHVLKAYGEPGVTVTIRPVHLDEVAA